MSAAKAPLTLATTRIVQGIEGNGLSIDGAMVAQLIQVAGDPERVFTPGTIANELRRSRA